MHRTMMYVYNVEMPTDAAQLAPFVVQCIVSRQAFRYVAQSR